MGCRKSKDQPNVVIILTDDQGWGDVGYNGNEILETPNLDLLAYQSIRFDRFYVSPVCAPTRASLLTGRYHLSTGVSWVTHRKEVMRQDEQTIAELLKTAGYNTGMFGKWHNGQQYPHDPTGQGFDTFVGFKEGHLNNYFNTTLTNGSLEVKTSGYVPDVLTDLAIEYMGDQKTPFLCYLALNTPHSPFQVPDHYFDKYKNKGLDDRTACIYGMIENIDDNVGKVIQFLRDTKQLEHTIVIFLSDNGPNGKRFNGGLMGIKSHVDEGGVKVPALIKYDQRKWNTGRSIDRMATHLDLLPTIVELTDVNVPEIETDGISLVPIVEQEATIDRMFFTHQVIRKFDTIPGAVRTNRYLLTMKPDGTQLFDLQKDPHQQLDIAAAHPDQVNELHKEYQQWFKASIAKGIVPELIETGHTQVEEVSFPAEQVSERVDLTFQGMEGWANDYLIQFTDSSMAAWETRTIHPMAYEIIAEISGTAHSVNVAVNDMVLSKPLENFLNKTEKPSNDRVVRGEVYEYHWPKVSLGTVKLQPGVNALRLSVRNPEKFELKSLKLKQIKP